MVMTNLVNTDYMPMRHAGHWHHGNAKNNQSRHTSQDGIPEAHGETIAKPSNTQAEKQLREPGENQGDEEPGDAGAPR